MASEGESMDAKMLRAMLVRRRACAEAREWSRGKTLHEAWETCERADWMMWLAATLLPRQRVVLAACACARMALRYVRAGEVRPRLAIETAEKWARGEATMDEVRSAAAAAYAASAADAAAAAAYAAAAAAYAASAADAASAAASAAAYAAYAAASAAYAAAAAAYAASAGTKAYREMADVVRVVITAAEIEAAAKGGK